MLYVDALVGRDRKWNDIMCIYVFLKIVWLHALLWSWSRHPTHACAVYIVTILSPPRKPSLSPSINHDTRKCLELAATDYF